MREVVLGTADGSVIFLHSDGTVMEGEMLLVCLATDKIMFLLFFVTDKKYRSSASFANKNESSLFKKVHFSLLSLNGMLEDPQGSRLTFQLASPVASDRFDPLASLNKFFTSQTQNFLFFQNADSRFSPTK